MIEIIREEDISSTAEKKGLPKDIKQMGSPDIGDRIYVEDRVYQYLHPYSGPDEKRAYVLLGRFENYSGKQCTFVEAAIPLAEMAFEGEMPLWNDSTWAYIYKQLRHEYDSMVIVGWAMDIRGQLPNMTVRLENLHQNNFGGAHQVLMLMDSLEKEEAFYGSRNGHLYRRDGFYIYYDKETSEQHEVVNDDIDALQEEMERQETSGDESQNSSGNQETYAAEGTSMEENAPAETELEEEHAGRNSFFDREIIHRGTYRKQVAKQEERQLIPSYASTLLLFAVVCTLGITAYLNKQKMDAMEATLAQMNQTQVVATEKAGTAEKEAQAHGVAVESVAGNVEKQEQVQTAADTAAGNVEKQEEVQTAADAVSETPDGETQTAASPAGTPGAIVDAAETSDATVDAAETAVETDTVSSEEEGAAPTEAAPTAAENTSAMTEAQMYLNQGYYVVQKGDSLVGICRKIYQTTAIMDKLCEINGIEDKDAIYAGQRLILPN